MRQDFGVNQGLIEELYLKYRENPASVSERWRTYFDSLDEEPLPPRRTANGTLLAPTSAGSFPTPTALGIPAGDKRSFAPGPETRTATELQSRVSAMVNAYRVRGHLFADLDPLGLQQKPPVELGLDAFGLDDVDPTTPFAAMAQTLPLAEIERRLRETYCRTIGVEVTQIEDTEERDWLQTRMESSLNRVDLEADEERAILTKLTEAEVWETWVHKAYKGKKRFSVEGGESTIPLLELIIGKGAELGVEEVVIGMAHRGRLNVLLNVMGLSPSDLLSEFEDASPERLMGRGDVKYHLGHSADRDFGGKLVHLTLAFNPSHLEFVNPVVEGRVRAKQDRRGDVARKTVLPLLIHGDAAFIGQGIVPETLNLANLRGYTTGGTVHVVINNQLGYTTVAEDGRSTRYCTDIVRMLRCPVFHVNGDDAEAVAFVAKLAAEYRQRYSKDVVIDLTCYRKYGHNEGDEPRFTQPIMYKAIDAKKTVRELYAETLLGRGRVTQEEVDALYAQSRKTLDQALDLVRSTKHQYEVPAFGGVWNGFKGGADSTVPDVETAVSADTLTKLATALGSLPPGFQVMRGVHANLLDHFNNAAKGGAMRWGNAESLAYATLLAEGYTVRVSGQDTQRGTFSHRLSVLHDMNDGRIHTPLLQVKDALGLPKQGLFEIYDSPLSEQGVMGFEWGYSLDCPNGLVIWEAQFGDFANGAQVIIDQFIASSEDKWNRLSGLVLLLPHGFEGGGPEHSSARLERFLNLAAEDNIQVVNLSNAAQVFHALRRQVKRPIRKPLIVMSPKSLFRRAETMCTIEELSTGSFQRIIPDREIAGKKAKRVILCSGKVYYDLAERRKKDGRDDVAIVRIEQLYPLRADEIREILSVYADGTDLVWVQEEPWNSGAWFSMNARLPGIIGDRFHLRCVARAESASPATGSAHAHELEQTALMDEAFAATPQKSQRPSARPRAN